MFPSSETVFFFVFLLRLQRKKQQVSLSHRIYRAGQKREREANVWEILRTGLTQFNYYHHNSISTCSRAHSPVHPYSSQLIRLFKRQPIPHTCTQICYISRHSPKWMFYSLNNILPLFSYAQWNHIIFFYDRWSNWWAKENTQRHKKIAATKKNAKKQRAPFGLYQKHGFHSNQHEQNAKKKKANRRRHRYLRS